MLCEGDGMDMMTPECGPEAHLHGACSWSSYSPGLKALCGLTPQESAVQNSLIKTLVTLGMRFTNTYTGGLQWMWYASKIGLQ